MNVRSIRLVAEYVQLTVGTLCIAVSINLFLIPNNVVDGGLTGIAQIGRSLFNVPVGLTTLVLNIPLFVLGWRYLGGVTFGARTIYATVLLSVAIDALAPLRTRFVIDEPLLYVFYGGLLDGVGIGLVFRVRGTTGGTDIVARLLQEWFGTRPGQALLMLSVGIYALAAWVYGATPVLYALLVSFISGRVVDVVQSGFSYARSAIIISEQSDAIRVAVLAEIGRGVTVLEGSGGYTATNRPVLLCVVAQSEESFLRNLIWRIDPHAFVVISEAAEVLGEGFKVRRS
jgi:uncharacterized membrane-anchored protein YitT (DUF2179 family)